jgi:hypothetical protein
MSNPIWESEDGTLSVSQFVGPAGPPDRRRWQFTVFTAGGTANVGRVDLEDLIAALMAAALERDGH